MWNEGNWQAQSEYTEALFNWAAKKDAAERERRNSRPCEGVIDDAVKAAERMLEEEDMAAEDKRKDHRGHPRGVGEGLGRTLEPP